MQEEDLIKPDRFMHDRCLSACFDLKDSLTKPEMTTLNAVAEAFSCGEPVYTNDYKTALAILVRVGG